MLKNLRSLFIVDVDEKNDSTQDSEKKKPEDVTSGKSTTSQKVVNSPQSVSKIDNRIVDKLLKAVEANNLEGFDYLEFKKSLKALEKMPMDEATKYRSAFATASTMGVTLDKLVQTIDFYLGVLDKENEQFLKAFKTQFFDKISNKEKEIVQFEDIIKKKSEKIKQLTQEISNHQSQIADLKKNLQESNHKIQKTQTDFKISYEYLKKQFEEDIIKLQKYLK